MEGLKEQKHANEGEGPEGVTSAPLSLSEQRTFLPLSSALSPPSLHLESWKGSKLPAGPSPAGDWPVADHDGQEDVVSLLNLKT